MNDPHSQPGAESPVSLPPVPQADPAEVILVKLIGGSVGGILGGLIWAWLWWLAVDGYWALVMLLLGCLGSTAMTTLMVLGVGLSVPANAGPTLRAIGKRMRLLQNPLAYIPPLLLGVLAGAGYCLATSKGLGAALVGGFFCGLYCVFLAMYGMAIFAMIVGLLTSLTSGRAIERHSEN